MFIAIVSTTSIDGKVRGPNLGERLGKYFPMPLSVQREIHKIRAGFDAILVGANTVRTDNPSLTVKLARVDKQPCRITVSKKTNLKFESNIFNGEAPSLLITSLKAPGRVVERLRSKGVEVVLLKDPYSVEEVVKILHSLGIRKLMIEGGPTLISTFLNAGVVNEILVIGYPLIVGGQVPALVSRKLEKPISTKPTEFKVISGFTFSRFEI